jgi:predicted RNA-binding Zn ribbon-like protein
MEPLFLAGHPGADFLNTWCTPDGQPVELIGDGAALLRWMQAAQLLDAATARRLRHSGPEALDAAAAEARELREWARDWLARWREAPQTDYKRELRYLNKHLERARWTRELTATREGLGVVECCRVESDQELVALLAAQLAALVATEVPALIKRCAGTDCSLWFVDRTKAHGRMFCSAAACGNRAKVAAFRQRQREAEK